MSDTAHQQSLGQHFEFSSAVPLHVSNQSGLFVLSDLSPKSLACYGNFAERLSIQVLPLCLQIQVQEMHSMGRQHLADMLKEAAARPFDLATGPMVHATLISMPQQDDIVMAAEHMLVISVPYSVADGWSMGVLFRDVSRAYNMLKLGQGASLVIACFSESSIRAAASHGNETDQSSGSCKLIPKQCSITTAPAGRPI